MTTLKEKSLLRKLSRTLYRDKYLLIMVIPGFVLLIVFRYIPIGGIVIVFQDYNPGKGILGSPWVGLKHMIAFFRDPYWMRITRNTVLLSVLMIVFTTPPPIILAICFNDLPFMRYKKVAQTISYMPNFISTVIVMGIVRSFVSYNMGKINDILQLLGGQRIDFLASPFWYLVIYVGSSIWQFAGFGAIIYLAALSGVNPELYEAAEMDGVKRFQKIWFIDIPALLPTITIMLIFSMGSIVASGDLQKILLIYNVLTYETADVIPTYLYRAGILGARYSYGAAVGFMQNIVSLAFVIFANSFARRVGETSLW